MFTHTHTHTHTQTYKYACIRIKCAALLDNTFMASIFTYGVLMEQNKRILNTGVVTC